MSCVYQFGYFSLSTFDSSAVLILFQADMGICRFFFPSVLVSMKELYCKTYILSSGWKLGWTDARLCSWMNLECGLSPLGLGIESCFFLSTWGIPVHFLMSLASSFSPASRLKLIMVPKLKPVLFIVLLVLYDSGGLGRLPVL